MIENLEQLDPMLLVLLGWLLGLLTPGFGERIRRYYRRRDLVRAVVDEMLGLQYTMADVAIKIRMRRSEVPDAFLDEILPIIEGYNGPERNESHVESIRNYRKLSEAQRSDPSRRNTAPLLADYAVPLFVSQMADLAICDLDFQRSVLRIRYHLELYNQNAKLTHALFSMTFNKPSREDNDALIKNRETAYEEAAGRAEIIMRAIGELKKKYESPKSGAQ